MGELEIWKRLKSHGMSDAGTAGVMGNYRAESGMCSYRVQGDFTPGYTKSKEFTAAADRGEKNESMQTGGGYGFCQWGGGRKYGLLLLSQERGVSVGNEMLGVDYTWIELQSAEYNGLRNTLLTTDSVAKAASDFCVIFERPAVANTAERTKYAQEFYNKYHGIKETDDMNKVIKAAVDWAVNMANDNTHGYDQSSRWGPNYDCSAFLISAWQQAGVPVKSQGATYTGNMRAVFQKCGFKVLSPSVEKEVGDVLLNDSQHTAMYVGNSQVVQASINEKGTITGGVSGDQTGREISVRSYYDFPWNCVLRYTGSQYAGTYEGDEIVYVTPSVPKVTVSNCTVTLPELKDGVKNDAVKSMQTLLILRHFSCGGSGADGDFGSGTLQGLKNFQSENGLTADGICGSLTWRKLIGG